MMKLSAFVSIDRKQKGSKSSKSQNASSAEFKEKNENAIEFKLRKCE